MRSRVVSVMRAKPAAAKASDIAVPRQSGVCRSKKAAAIAGTATIGPSQIGGSTLMAIGQSLPGANGVKLSVLIGRHLRGGIGAFAAPLAFLSGPFVIILVVGAIYGRIANYSPLHAVLDGVAAAVVGLTLSTGISAVARGAGDWLAVAISAVTVLCVGILGWPMLPVILVLAPVSIGLMLVRARTA